MPMHNLIEYSDNHSDTSGRLWQSKRDKENMHNGNPANVTTDDSRSFKYKSSFFKPLRAADNGVFKDVKIAVPLKYLSKGCVMSNIADTTFKITNTKLYVPIVTLSRKDNVKLVKLLEEGFKRPVYWNEYQAKIESRNLDNDNLTLCPLDYSFQDVRRLFVLAFDTTDNGANKVERNSHTKYFLPRVNITNYNVLIDGRNFYDQPINDLVKQYDEIRKTATGQGDDYTTGCLLDYQYFKDH